MKRLLPLLVTGVLAGCSGEQAKAPTPDAKTETPSSTENATTPANIPRVAVPEASASSDSPPANANGTTAPVTVSATPSLPPLVEKSSDYPAALSRAINLWNQLDALPGESTAISEELGNELVRYADNIRELTQGNYDKLDKEKRTQLEEFSEKLAYQAERAKKSSTSATVTILKANLGYIHQGLSSD